MGTLLQPHPPHRTPHRQGRRRPAVATAPSGDPAAPRRPRRRLSLGAARRRGTSLSLNMAAELRGGWEVSGTPVEVSGGRGRDRGRAAPRRLLRAGSTAGARSTVGLSRRRVRGGGPRHGGEGNREAWRRARGGRGLRGQARARAVRGLSARSTFLGPQLVVSGVAPAAPQRQMPSLNFPGRANPAAGASAGCSPID